MVGLILASSKGKTALRFFPYEGFLGYSPVTVRGVVKTRLDSDNKSLAAASIVVSVKCIESQIGFRSNSSKLIAQYSSTLWTKPDGQDFLDITCLELPFRISIPVTSPGPSTSVFVEYRCIWRIEAVLNHIPIPGVGHCQFKQFQLPLVRYDLPLFTPTPSIMIPPLLQQTHKPGAPSIRYTINPPTTPIGPLDMVSVPIYIFPLDTSIVIRSAVATVERRIQLSPAPTSDLLSPDTALPVPASTSTTSLASLIPSETLCDATTPTILSEDSSNHTITSYTSTSTIHRPLLPHSTPTETHTPPASSHPVISVQSTGHFNLDTFRGVYSKTLTLQWPESKSHSRWNVGSTLHSTLASVRFFLRVKVVVSSSSASSATHTLELSEKELLIVPTNEAERQLANSYISDHDNSRSPSKSPRRASKGVEADPLPPLPSSASRHRSKHSSSSSTQPGRQKRKTFKRPHTSSGVLSSSASASHSSNGIATGVEPQKSTPKRWVSANANIPPSCPPSSSQNIPSTSPSRHFISSLFGSPKISSIPSGTSNSSESASAVGGSTSSASSEESINGSHSGSRSDRSDLEEEHLFESTPSKSSLWTRGRIPHDRPKPRPRSSLDLRSSHPRDMQFEPPAETPDIAPQIRAWEEELARIEKTSQSSSSMISFGIRRRRRP